MGSEVRSLRLWAQVGDQTPPHANFCVYVTDAVHGWPSGLRRQTQAFTCREKAVERSGTRKGAWVQIPLRANFCDPSTDSILLKLRSRAVHVARWPSGLRRWFKAPVPSGAWVRIPLSSTLLQEHRETVVCVGNSLHQSRTARQYELNLTNIQYNFRVLTAECARMAEWSKAIPLLTQYS